MLAAAIPDTLATQGPQRAALYTRLAILPAAESLAYGSAFLVQMVAPGGVRAAEKGPGAEIFL